MARIYEIQIRTCNPPNEQQAWDAADLDSALWHGDEQEVRNSGAEVLELSDTPMVVTTTLHRRYVNRRWAVCYRKA